MERQEIIVGKFGAKLCEGELEQLYYLTASTYMLEQIEKLRDYLMKMWNVVTADGMNESKPAEAEKAMRALTTIQQIKEDYEALGELDVFDVREKCNESK